jgi:hypothetical protein
MRQVIAKLSCPPLPSQLFPLRSVPNGTDNHPLAAHTIENNVGSAADDQLADSRLGSGAAQARMVPESFNHGDDSRGQPLRSRASVELPEAIFAL